MRVDGADDVGRIIPAYAGSTLLDRGDGAGSEDHPRIRGEHLPKPPAKTGSVGSSPHTRGAPDQLDVPRFDFRIIPAYAGSTETAPCLTRSMRDHPRIRGEHGIPKIRATEITGSSPHTRGARTKPIHVPRQCRIIPAYAGSTWTFKTA